MIPSIMDWSHGEICVSPLCAPSLVWAQIALNTFFHYFV